MIQALFITLITNPLFLLVVGAVAVSLYKGIKKIFKK